MRRLRDAGAVDALRECMLRFIGHREVQRNALTTLCALAEVADEADEGLVDMDALTSAVSAAMRAHSECPSVQRLGCCLAFSLALRGEALCEILRTHGLLESVVEAMKSHPKNKSLQTIACAVIFRSLAEPAQDFSVTGAASRATFSQSSLRWAARTQLRVQLCAAVLHFHDVLEITVMGSRVLQALDSL